MSTLQATISTGKDDWRTPTAVLRSSTLSLGSAWDAASSVRPGVSEVFFGPGSPWHLDGLEPWPRLPSEVPLVAWINPPYSRRAGGGRASYRGTSGPGKSRVEGGQWWCCAPRTQGAAGSTDSPFGLTRCGSSAVASPSSTLPPGSR